MNKITNHEVDISEVTIGIVTALPEEYAACKRILDPSGSGFEHFFSETHGVLDCWICDVAASDQGTHKVALTMLPDMGNNMAAIVTNNLFSNCQEIKHVIMCGIAGAVPNPTNPENHVRIGDIVVTDRNGIFQYDLGKQRDPKRINVDQNDPFSGFVFRNAPRPPCPLMLRVLRKIIAEEKIRAKHVRRPWELLFEEFLQGDLDKDDWKRPSPQKDILNDSADGKGPKVTHPRDSARRAKQPRVFLGPIGAANIVQADPQRRDALRDRFGVKAVEMESSGLADASWLAGVGYIAVRGTCDYCNTCKDDVWHNYAAAIAASFTKTLLERMPSSKTRRPTVNDNTQNQARLANVLENSVSPWELRPSNTNEKPLAEQHTNSTPLDQKIVFGEESLTYSSKENRGELSQEFPELTDRVQQLEDLIENAPYEEAAQKGSQLESKLKSLPRKGMIVRAGWILVAKLELIAVHKVINEGRKPDTTRLSELNAEAASVTD